MEINRKLGIVIVWILSGGVFEYKGNLYIITDQYHKGMDKILAVKLTDGHVATFGIDTLVKEINGHFMVEE